jgi:hypothetical protein
MRIKTRQSTRESRHHVKIIGQKHVFSCVQDLSSIYDFAFDSLIIRGATLVFFNDVTMIIEYTVRVIVEVNTYTFTDSLLAKQTLSPTESQYNLTLVRHTNKITCSTVVGS